MVQISFKLQKASRLKHAYFILSAVLICVLIVMCMIDCAFCPLHTLYEPDIVILKGIEVCSLFFMNFVYCQCHFYFPGEVLRIVDCFYIYSVPFTVACLKPFNTFGLFDCSPYNFKYGRSLLDLLRDLEFKQCLFCTQYSFRWQY